MHPKMSVVHSAQVFQHTNPKSVAASNVAVRFVKPPSAAVQDSPPENSSWAVQPSRVNLYCMVPGSKAKVALQIPLPLSVKGLHEPHQLLKVPLTKTPPKLPSYWDMSTWKVTSTVAAGAGQSAVHSPKQYSRVKGAVTASKKRSL